MVTLAREIEVNEGQLLGVNLAEQSADRIHLTLDTEDRPNSASRMPGSGRFVFSSQ